MFFFLVFFFSLGKVNHLLSFLLSLEMLGVLFLLVIMPHLAYEPNFIIVMFFVVILSMESVMGLVLFILFSRDWSKDYIFSLSLVKF